MPLIDTHLSLVASHPRVIRQKCQLRVVQRRLLGLVFMAMATLVPGGILVGEVTKGRIKSWSQLIEKVMQLNTAWLIGVTIIGLFFAAIFLWGLFWVFWKRDLIVDLSNRSYTFTTGVGPWKHRRVGNCDDPLKFRLFRKVYTKDSAQNTAMSGQLMESWELSLEFPRIYEPLYLGEWGKLDEAEEEIAAWQEIFPCSSLEK